MLRLHRVQGFKCVDQLLGFLLLGLLYAGVLTSEGSRLKGILSVLPFVQLPGFLLLGLFVYTGALISEGSRIEGNLSVLIFCAVARVPGPLPTLSALTSTKEASVQSEQCWPASGVE